MPNLLRIAPELPVANLRESLEYYTEKLGFETVMEMSAGDYAIVERDGVAIHLFQAAHAAGGGRVSLHVFTEGLEELQEELQRRGADVIQTVSRKPWGARDFRVRDDAGNELKFTEPARWGDRG
jgi:uncharacterized glyoxalase superfamily protein PhnB